MTERWAPVPDWPEYEVSDHGRVRRVGAATGAIVGRVLRPMRHKGYLRVDLSSGNVVTRCLVHRLVASAFLPTPPEAGQTHVAHGDGDSGNNHWRNLRWATPADNADDRKRHGRYALGVRHVMAKLSDADVAAIKRAAGSASQWAIARRYGVTQSTVSRIQLGKGWSHVA